MFGKLIRQFLSKQFLKYFLIGISGVVLDMTTLFILKNFFDMRPVTAVIINQLLMLNYIFFLNKKWSFGAAGLTHRQMIRYYILAGVNYLFSVLWMWALNENLGIHYMITRMMNIALAVSWNFLLYKFWVFADKKIPAAE